MSSRDAPFDFRAQIPDLSSVESFTGGSPTLVKGWSSQSPINLIDGGVPGPRLRILRIKLACARKSKLVAHPHERRGEEDILRGFERTVYRDHWVTGWDSQPSRLTSYPVNVKAASNCADNFFSACDVAEVRVRDYFRSDRLETARRRKSNP